MQYTFNRLWGAPLAKIISHVQEAGGIGLEDLPAFRDPDCIATSAHQMWKLKQMNRKFAQYYSEFPVIAAGHNWNPLALRNAL
jgi:hypothetical protein